MSGWVADEVLVECRNVFGLSGPLSVAGKFCDIGRCLLGGLGGNNRLFLPGLSGGCCLESWDFLSLMRAWIGRGVFWRLTGVLSVARFDICFVIY